MSTKVLFALFAIGSAQLAIASPTGDLLRRNDVAALESVLVEVQQRFEKGEATEIELRNTYRAFYDLDQGAAHNLIKWAASSPKSYVAHLALGIYYKRRGADARGDKYMADISQSDIDRMSGFYGKAAEELRSSMLLTGKPYLSVFHLLSISTQFGDRATSLTLLRKANELLPENALVRNRYALSLTPRWGGSYDQLDAFISATKTERVPTSVVLQLQAIELDDKGQSLKERQQHAAAMEHFQKALAIGARVGGTFVADFLNASRCNMCTGPNDPCSCP